MAPPLPGPPPLPPRRTPTADHRQAACTHTTVTRLFDTYGSTKCQICHRHPGIGWVYRCTQDYGGFLPESDFMHNAGMEHIQPCDAYDGAEERWGLSPWIVRAIEQDQYTPHQIKTMSEQRRSVMRAILQQESQTDTPSLSSVSTDLSQLTSSVETSVISPPTAIDTRSSVLQSDGSAESKFTSIASLFSAPETTDANTQPIAELPTLPCDWTSCQTCRPTYRDRAYLSLDSVIDNPCQVPPEWELENRRISHARILMGIGLPKLRHVNHNLNFSYQNDNSDAPVSSSSNLTDSIGCDATGSPPKTKTGFRSTVRHVLHSFNSTINAQANARRSADPSLDSNLEPTRRFSRSALFMRPRSIIPRKRGSNEKSESQLQGSGDLTTAANTPLPDAARDAEDLRGGEVMVEDGVAVEEEGVSMSAADLILHV